jgi:hypothetical protein
MLSAMDLGVADIKGYWPVLTPSGRFWIWEWPDFNLTNLTELPWHFRHTIPCSLGSSDLSLDS